MGIEFKEAADDTPKKVLKVIPAQAYFVNYNDGVGRMGTRVAFRIDGSKNTYLLSEKISGDLVVKEAAPWLHSEFTKALKREGFEGPEGGAESL